jgi:hypothetical protein
MARNGTTLFNTLQHLHEWKCALHVTRRRCKHRSTVYLPSLIEQYGPTTELAEIVPSVWRVRSADGQRRADDALAVNYNFAFRAMRQSARPPPAIIPNAETSIKRGRQRHSPTK